MKRHVLARILALLAVPALCVTAPVAAHAAAGAGTGSGDGWIRLAHLSPNTPAVDVYLYSFGDSSAMIVLKHVGYGDVSPYERVASGQYSVAMRAAGAAATSSPVLSTSVQIEPGHAYTVAGMGPESGLRLTILDDQLTTPPDHALVRVIQASLLQHVVNVALGGHTVAPSLAFASVSGYQTVAPGTDTIRVTAAGGDANKAVTLAAETVHTLVVLDGSKGLEVVDLEDAAGNTSIPASGVATGLGGTAPQGPASTVMWLVLIAAGSALVLAGATRMWLLRRWRVTRLTRLRA
ncbi:MAG: DUF4397 domain-containing protein [Streptosporangiaceae bacterium]|nr:DUF4397 domain-containing protein [Streptosporangiaceae bacterium]